MRLSDRHSKIIKEVEKEGYTIKKTKLTIGDYLGFIALIFFIKTKWPAISLKL